MRRTIKTIALGTGALFTGAAIVTANTIREGEYHEKTPELPNFFSLKRNNSATPLGRAEQSTAAETGSKRPTP